MTECIFSWGKQYGTMRKTKHRGIGRVAADFLLNLIAYNLIRIPKLMGLRFEESPLRICKKIDVEAPISGKTSCRNFGVSYSGSNASGYFTVDWVPIHTKPPSPKIVQTFAGHSSPQVTMDPHGHWFESDDHNDVFFDAIQPALKRVSSQTS